MAVVDGFLERARGVAIPVIVRDVTVIVLYLIVSIIVLSNFGVDLTGILTGSVVLTAVVGLAMQDTLGSIASGLALQIERPFQENDWILFDGVTGRVLEINWRTTKLWTHADEIIHIPNKELTSQRLTNLSQPDVHHRRQITLGLPYDIPPNQCKELLEAAAQTEGVLNTPPPFATLSEFGESSIRYTLSFYLTNIRTYLQIEDRVLTNIWYRLHRSGIEIPYPTRTITTYEGGTKALPHSAFDSTAARERVLQSVPFLSLLPEEERTDLAKRITLQTYGARETVIQQGQEGDSLFIIRDGEVEVLVDTPSLQQPRRVAMLGAGEFFGEMSLLTGERRSATIRTLSDANFYLIEHEVFADVLAKHRDLHEQIAAVLEERLKNLKNQSSLNSGAVEPTADPQDDETVLSRIRIFFGL
jgi:CRP-like cAMP-binding protein